MKTLEQLKEENRILKERQIGNEQIIKQNKEDRREAIKIRAENVALKNPKKVRFVKKVGSGAKDLGKGLLWGLNKAGTQYAKAQASKEPQARTKKVKRVKKVKKKSNNPFGFEPRFSFN